MIQLPLKLFIYLAALFFLLSVSLPASGENALSPTPDAANLSLNGTAFQDADGNGFPSAGENGLANAAIRLILEGKEISNTTTNESGQYFFGNLSIGRYELRADPFPGCNQTAPGGGFYEVTLSDKPGYGLDYGFFAPSNLTASLPVREYPLMRPTRQEANAWAGQYNSSDRAYLSPEIAAKMAAAPAAAVSLLSQLKYTPSERDQGSCGNCWAWAGTGVMEIDYARQMGKTNRLSVQYLDSSYNGGCGSSGACCGGWLSSLAGFYRARGMLVPWSNANAYYRDGGLGCGLCSPVSASSISTNPHYELKSITTSTIPTHGLARETAISNIKNVLSQGKAIWFAYYLPDSSAWSNFFRFWSAQPESAVWQPDISCGRSYNYQSGGGHAVLCVGYDDTDPKNRYWIMLNSWGTTAGRPAGLFRVNMDMNYDCSYSGLGYVFYWMTLDMSYPEIINNPPQKPARPQGTAAGIVQKSYSYTASAIDRDGDDVRITFDWGDGNTSQTDLANSGASVRLSHTWDLAGTYPVRVMATDRNEAASLWSISKAVKISNAPRHSLAGSSPAAKTENAGQGKKTCPCSKKSE